MSDYSRRRLMKVSGIVASCYLTISCKAWVPGRAPLHEWSHEARDGEYRRSVEEWMDSGKRESAMFKSDKAWATYSFIPVRLPWKAEHTPQELSQVATDFTKLCRAQGGEPKKGGEYTGLSSGRSPIDVCYIDGEPFFAMAMRESKSDTGRPALYIDHFDAAALRAVKDEHKAREVEREEAAKQAEGARIEREKRAVLSEQLSQEVRANLRPGDDVRVKVHSDMVDVSTGHRISMGNKIVPALVLEVKLPIVHIQTSRPVQAFWVRVEDIHHP